MSVACFFKSLPNTKVGQELSMNGCSWLYTLPVHVPYVEVLFQGRTLLSSIAASPLEMWSLASHKHKNN